jgi:beta-fructofuranosidase
MPRTFSVLSSLLCLGSVFAQDASTTSSSAVPTGTPVAGDYGGALRPQVHFSPPKGFMVCFYTIAHRVNELLIEV